MVNTFGGLCLYVCNTDMETFKTRDLESLVLVCVYIFTDTIKFVSEGHPVKVKVIGAKKHEVGSRCP